MRNSGNILVCSAVALGLFVALSARQVSGQSFGVEMHNTMMPASGGMAGTGIALPQDLTSAINGNPASLTQFHGTQFSFGGGWAEPTYNLQHAGGVLPNVGAFAGKSEAQGGSIGNIGVTQDFSALGLPATLGIGFFTAAGGGVDYRAVPASNGTSSALFVFEITNSLGIALTNRLSAGASLSMGTGIYDGPFVGISALAYDYALRGSVGLNYDLGADTTVGFYYQTKQSFTFEDAILLDLGGGAFSAALDINMDLPDNIGLGIANQSLMNGRLLLAVDALYKQWDNADMFGAVYDNQWVIQTGAQYQAGRLRFRLGYAIAENAMQPTVGGAAGGVAPPGVAAAIQFLQGQMAAINEHRITAGVGVRDMLPGVDFDLFAGGMFEASQQFGPLTSASVESYWLGAAMTWRFGRGACEYGDWSCP